MDLIYTDSHHNELGVIKNYELDFDTTSQKDYQLVLSIDDMVLKGGYYWYVNGTEYGGRVDRYKVDSDTITYSGRNFRGLLDTYIVQPLPTYPYAIYSGPLDEIVNKMLRDAKIRNLFVCDACEEYFAQYKFNRYITLYQAILSIAVEYNKLPAFKVKNGMVHISFENVTDYTNEVEYTSDDYNFVIEKSYGSVNHLICLGRGELEEREVIHLYADRNGNISTNQSLFGEEEVQAVYDNSNSDDLMKDGIAHFEEIKDLDKFEVTTTRNDFKIGDIIGGYERLTETYVAREIENIIFKSNDEEESIDYKVGQDDTATARKSKKNGSKTADKYGLYVSDDGNLFFIADDDAENVPLFELEDGNLFVTAPDVENYNYDQEHGVVWYNAEIE